MKKLVFFFVFVCCAFLAQAQKNYAVKIADSKTEDPLDKATVIIKSANKKAITNETGLLVIQAEPGDILTISCHGYISQEATLSASSSVIVFLVKKPEKRKRKH
ncbi:MAG: carboxypeptidase-like regulatory domain-containing protein [Chitinophagaceae bacterium]|nr:carboxypeptidase-like regulatory domain-containing protein [Chitinophagaceae bacterium]